MIPKSVTVDQVAEAAKPLLDLLGVTVNELYSLHWANERVTLVGVLRAEGDTAERPAGVRLETFPLGDARADAEATYYATVEVI